MNYNSDDFIRWASEIGTNTTQVTKYFLSAGTAPEQGYKSCASLTKLGERYGKRKLETACQQVLSYTTAPNIRLITSLLKNPPAPKSTTKTPPKESHAITRGADYYRKGGGSK